jgi:hypothetical protein
MNTPTQNGCTTTKNAHHKVHNAQTAPRSQPGNTQGARQRTNSARPNNVQHKARSTETHTDRAHTHTHHRKNTTTQSEHTTAQHNNNNRNPSGKGARTEENKTIQQTRDEPQWIVTQRLLSALTIPGFSIVIHKKNAAHNFNVQHSRTNSFGRLHATLQ